MYIPKSLLSRLLGAAWTVFLISVLLWLAVHLLAEVWLWVVGIIVLAVVFRIAFWLRHFRRDQW